ncbi:MAG TPA: trimeric intracellular cation channel family protein [Nevskiaceae bacterium]|nr:trimeric intracellular cation channel family protein [Nevskiaceae bacterium]
MLHGLDYVGVAVFAISGALAAGRKSLDLLGVVVIAMVTAIGGGTLRDLLMDRHPVFWIARPEFLAIIAIAALLTVPYTRFARPPDKILQVADALGLALFSISGARIAQDAGHPGLIVVVMGTITGVFGGVLRDVLVAEIPMILRRGNIYATAAIAGCSLYVLLQMAGFERNLCVAAGMATIALLRLAAIVYNLQLPVFSLHDDR